MIKKASIKDVAKKAGVSTTLVSYILNGKMIDRINKSTALAVKAVAKELNYKPNNIAKSLKMQKTLTIGLIVSDISNPFSSSLARLLEDEALQKDYTLIIGSCDENKEKSQRIMDTFLNRCVDGFIIAPAPGTEEQIANLLSQNIPFVLIDRYFSLLQTNNVSINNYQSGYNAVQHLVDVGKKNIAIVSYSGNLLPLEERLRGFKAAMEANKMTKGLAKRIALVDVENQTEQMANYMDLLTAENSKVDAIFFTNNKLAIAGLKILLQKNIKIPDELAIVAFDETDVFDLFYVPITYVKQPLEDMAKKTIEILMANISASNIEPVNVVLDTELVIRGSSVA